MKKRRALSKPKQVKKDKKINLRRQNKMPLLQYKCAKCGKKFEEIVQKFDDEVRCPACGERAERDWSGEMFSATGKPAKKCSGNCKTCGGCK